MGILYYVQDPMCSWCYAFGPVLKKTLDNISSDIKVVYVSGGLTPHNSEPMSKEMQNMVENTWKQIQLEVGIKFNFDFWTKCKPRRSTYLACQAVISARLQGKEYEMILAIQEQYYLNASNPSDKDTLELAAHNINLDLDKFNENLESNEVIKTFEEDLKLRNKLNVNGFPSLVFKYKNNYFPIKIDFNDHANIVNQIKDLNDNIYF